MVHKKIRERQDKKKQRNMLLIGIFIVAVLVFSMFYMGIGDQGGQNKFEYNGYHILPIENSQYFGIQMEDDSVFQFLYLPIDLENISANIGYTFSQNKIYVVVDESFANTINLFPIGQIYKGIQFQNAVIDENDTRDFPIVSCDEGTDILVVEKGNMSAEKNSSCLIIKANNMQEITMVLDRMLYNTLGVMS